MKNETTDKQGYNINAVYQDLDEASIFTCPVCSLGYVVLDRILYWRLNAEEVS